MEHAPDGGHGHGDGHGDEGTTLPGLAIAQGAYRLHPEPGGAPAVRFRADLPTPGTYAAYFDYQVDGKVNTAFTSLEVRAGH